MFVKDVRINLKIIKTLCRRNTTKNFTIEEQYRIKKTLEQLRNNKPT